MRAGLARDDLFTVVFDAVWTDTARVADVVLPATTFLEHDELARGYGGYVLQAARPVVPRRRARRARTTPCSASWSGASACGATAIPRAPEALIDALLASTPDGPRLREALARDGRAVPAFGATPVQFVDVFPRTPGGKIDLCPPALDREAPDGLYGYRPDPATAAAPLALISPASSHTISSTFGQLVPGAGADRAGARGRAPRGIARRRSRARVERARRGSLSGRGEPRPAAGRRDAAQGVVEPTHRQRRHRERALPGHADRSRRRRLLQ